MSVPWLILSSWRQAPSLRQREPNSRLAAMLVGAVASGIPRPRVYFASGRRHGNVDLQAHPLGLREYLASYPPHRPMIAAEPSRGFPHCQRSEVRDSRPSSPSSNSHSTCQSVDGNGTSPRREIYDAAQPKWGAMKEVEMTRTPPAASRPPPAASAGKSSDTRRRTAPCSTAIQVFLISTSKKYKGY